MGPRLRPPHHPLPQLKPATQSSGRASHSGEASSPFNDQRHQRVRGRAKTTIGDLWSQMEVTLCEKPRPRTRPTASNLCRAFPSNMVRKSSGCFRFLLAVNRVQRGVASASQLRRNAANIAVGPTVVMGIALASLWAEISRAGNIPRPGGSARSDLSGVHAGWLTAKQK